MIKLSYRGFLGNQLFQYSIAKFLANNWGCSLESTRNNWSSIDFDPRQLFETYEDQFIGKKLVGPQSEINGQYVNLQYLLELGPQPLLINGFFENYQTFKPFKKEIKEQLTLNRSMLTPLSSNDLVMHLRFSEPKENKWWKFKLPNVALDRLTSTKTYFRDLISSLQFSRLIIVTNRPSDPFVQSFERYKPVIQCDSILTDFAFMSSAKKFVMSPSTFSWWAAWLSEAETVYFPPSHCWATDHQRAGSLFVDDEDRYVIRPL